MLNPRTVNFGLWRAVQFAALLLPSLSQAAPLPGGLDPGQIEKRFQAPTTPRATPKPIAVPATAGLEAPTGAASIRLTPRQIQIEGATVFAADELKALYAELLNREIGLDQIYGLAARITTRYGNAGYLLSRAIIPPQTIEGGLIRIQIVEGYVDEVIVEGMNGRRPDLFSHYIAQITASRPLHAKVLERYLLLANDLPGVRFKSVLSPSKVNIGAATLTLSAARDPWEGGISLDNRGSETSGPWQLLLEASANDLMRRLEGTTLRYVTIPDSPEELRYWQLSHLQTLNGEGLRLGFDLNATDSEPGGTLLQQLNVETRGRSASAFLNYPLIRSREENLGLSGSLVARTSETMQLIGDTEDQLYILRLGVAYDRADAWGGGGVNLFSATLHQGLDAFDAQVESRFAASPDFTRLELQARRNQRLTDRWSADLRLNGQLADGSLPASEQFPLGGENSVRGYEPAEWTGDRALNGSVELIYRPQLTWSQDLQLYGFYDYGQIWRASPLPAEFETVTAEACGLGTRISLPHDIALNLEAAKPQQRHADRDDPDWQIYGRVRISF